MAITPGMAKYIDTYINQKNDGEGDYVEYRDRDYYNGETYGLVVKE